MGQGKKEQLFNLIMWKRLYGTINLRKREALKDMGNQETIWVRLKEQSQKTKLVEVNNFENEPSDIIKYYYLLGMVVKVK